MVGHVVLRIEKNPRRARPIRGFPKPPLAKGTRKLCERYNVVLAASIYLAQEHQSGHLRLTVLFYALWSVVSLFFFSIRLALYNKPRSDAELTGEPIDMLYYPVG